MLNFFLFMKKKHNDRSWVFFFFSPSLSLSFKGTCATLIFCSHSSSAANKKNSRHHPIGTHVHIHLHVWNGLRLFLYKDSKQLWQFIRNLNNQKYDVKWCGVSLPFKVHVHSGHSKRPEATNSKETKKEEKINN